MSLHERAGHPAQPEDLVDVARLVTAYYTETPDPEQADQRVAFGTSGHRGSSLHVGFNDDAHRRHHPGHLRRPPRGRHDGPLFLASDTHALSEPAWATALEVLAANDVQVLVDARDRYTPTPALSHAVLVHNRGRTTGLADGIVITPSHNPPADGGFKYNPPHGGPAGSDITGAGAGRRERAPARRPRARAAGAAGPGAHRRHHRHVRLPRPRTSTTCRRCSTSTPSARRACASAPTRSAAPASTTGARSPSGTGST